MEENVVQPSESIYAPPEALGSGVKAKSVSAGVLSQSSPLRATLGAERLLTSTPAQSPTNVSYLWVSYVFTYLF